MTNIQMFFITGMGRSGTKFLAELLDKCPGASVYHEAPEDRNALIRAYWQPNEQLSSTRIQLIWKRIDESQCSTYGEVNSYLRFFTPYLRVFLDAIVMHIVRDGRAVVRSTMTRKAFTDGDLGHTGKVWPKRNSIRQSWIEMSRFQKVCWYWDSTIVELLEKGLPIIRFEDIISSYSDFCAQVLDPLKLELSEDVWKMHASKPVNATTRFKFPVWKNWTDEQKDQFKEICGSNMGFLGYSL